jgi:two-component system LytT family sensor kinase
VDLKIAAQSLDALVPFMILQPIVENAIEHGISAQCEGSTITIKAEVEKDELHLSVSDSGPASNSNIAPDHHDTRTVAASGLANTRERP